MFWAQRTIQTKVLRQEGNTVSEAMTSPLGLIRRNTVMLSRLGLFLWEAQLTMPRLSLQKSCPGKGGT